VGRTARYKSKGNALLFVLPSEVKFLEKLSARNIQQKKLNARADRQLTIQPVLSKLNAESHDLQHLAKRACASYLRSIFLMKDKSVFDVHAIDTQKLATSYGLLNAPQINVV
jgi:ATP-dependent RNA helicase DDX10/DBP4